jgi:NAD(P)-dependent dehydrogenase (short-subunit alcohol dehydrogenase family)
MKRFLIVGASSGIGKGIKERLMREGHQVITIGRSFTETSTFLQYDIMSDAPFPSIEGNLDGIVYCPGSINLKPFRALKPEDFLQDFQLNVMGAIKTLQAYLKNLQGSANASVVLFSTVAVQSGMPFHSSIAASKGAIEGLTRSLAAEMAPKIRCNALAPSLTLTPLADRLTNSPEKLEAAANRHPLKRIGNIDDLAAIATFLLSDESSWITGQVIHVDGGLSSLKL